MTILTVAELSNNIKSILEGTLNTIRVKGEVIQPKRHTSGHLYFTIKQDLHILDCVSWRNVKLDFEPAEGSEVVCTGTVTIYSGRSKYQMNIINVEHIGLGIIMKRIEDLKKRLLAEGIFDLNKNLRIPKFPKSIGIATSATGSVIHDMLHRLRDRHPTLVYLYPIQVQGNDVVNNAISAINYFHSINVDLIIIARGGGSFEDLLPFNDEVIVRAVANSKIPVVTAIGHETDTTLIDYASNLRAPTPTAAIELITPERSAILSYLKKLDELNQNAINRVISSCHMIINHILRFDIRQYIQIALQRLDYSLYEFLKSLDNYWLKLDILVLKPIYRPTFTEQAHRLTALIKLNEYTMQKLMTNWISHLEKISNLIEAISYHGTLNRGFCLAKSKCGNSIKNKSDALLAKQIIFEFHDGSVLAEVID